MNKSFVIGNDKLQVGVCDVGAAIEYLRVNVNGKWQDVCLTFDDASQRIKSGTYCGAVVGRVANRIAGASFCLDGKRYKLSANDGDNTLHGGENGFDKRVFTCTRQSGDALELCLESDDGDQGFPAKVRLRVVYGVSGASLKTEFFAESSADTFFAPTLHAYFRLGKCAMRDKLQIFADSYLPIDSASLPTSISPVQNTPFDFRTPKPIARDVDSCDGQLKLARGYDHCFVLKGDTAAIVQGGGIRMTVKTNLPGIQLYTANYFVKSANCPYAFREGYALEPQYFPNAVNRKEFAQPLLKKGVLRRDFIEFSFDK